MPRNPAVEAKAKAVAAERNYRAAQKALAATLAARKKAMVACVAAGMTLGDTAKLFGVTHTAISNARAELARKKTAA